MPSRPNRVAALRTHADLQFERLATWVARRPGWVIGLCLAWVAAGVAPIPSIVFSTSPEESLFPDHPVRAAYTDFKEQFGSDGFVVITIETAEVFDREFLVALRELHEGLEERVPYVEEITSLINVRSTRGEADELIVEDLLEEWPDSDADLRALEARVRATEFYRRTFVDDDGNYTAIVLELVRDVASGFDPLAFDDPPESPLDGAESPRLISTPEEIEVIRAVEAAIADWSGPAERFHVAGLPVTNTRIVQDIGENFGVFLVFSSGSMVVVLVALFRRASGVLLPLVVVSSALIGTFGFIGWRGTPVNMTAQILPSFLMAVGASASIHILVLFFQRYDAGEERTAALRKALGHGGSPITMACLTTAVGLGSFQVAELAPIQDLGVLAPLGIAFAWFYALVLLPALLSVVPLRRKPRPGERSLSPVGRAVVTAGDFSVRHPRSVVATTGCLVALGLYGATQLEYEFNAMEWFPLDDPIHLDTEIADRRMGGSIGIEVLLDSGRENGLHDPDLQRRIEGFEAAAVEVGGAGFVRKTASVNGVLKEIHQALNENRAEFYATPGDRELIAQELLLFEASGSDDLEEMVDSQFRLARLSLRSVWASPKEYTPVLDRLDALLDEWFPDEEVSLTGTAPIIIAGQLETRDGMTGSYTVALLTITPIMMLMIGSLRGGLVSMVPNLMPIIVVLGLMGWTGIRIDIFTMLTGSVAIGLAVDDTIHFLHNFYREFDRTGDARGSVRRTLETTGQALLTTSIVLSLGFGTFLLASMPTLQLFGAVTALAIILAFLADILVAPALVTLATRHRRREITPP